MKKLSVSIGSIIIGGMFMAGCSEEEPVALAADEVINEVTEDFTPQTGPFSKYQTVTEYIKGIADRWVNETIKSENDVITKSEMEVVNDALVYADWFQDEIAEMGLKEDFDKLNSVGSSIVNLRENEPLGELRDKFKNQIGEILSQIEGTGVVKKSPNSQIKHWASASIEILSEPIEANDAEGIAMKARKVLEGFPNHLLSDDYETEEEKIHSGMFLLVSEILHLQSFAENDEDVAEVRAKFKELKKYMEEVAAEAVGKSEAMTKDESRLAKLKEQTVEHGEYSSLENFVYDISDGLQEPSIKRSKIANPEYHLAYVTIPYVNYFEDEITALGLNADFDELQLLADDVLKKEFEEDFDKQHVGAFKDKLSDVIRKIHEESRFDDMPSWVAASIEILSEPLGKFDENTKIAAWRARQVAYSFPNHKLSEFGGLDSEEGKIHAKTHLLMNEIQFNHFVADSAKHYETVWAKYDELKQYMEEVAEEYQ
ncbi:hypothetical protein AB1K89_03475 [Sporosarcina sp. 179-K 8C2 HS]|uniref:hypothetical protein n=1 Tax=Sporosarcina sp. 179-K 8C2 HS TaxID=3142387 RepID=UPI00399F6607